MLILSASIVVQAATGARDEVLTEHVGEIAVDQIHLLYRSRIHLQEDARRVEAGES